MPVAAASRPDVIGAVVSRGGRPDLTGPVLTRVLAPTQLLIGGDVQVIELNRATLDYLNSEKQLVVVPRHLFEGRGCSTRSAVWPAIGSCAISSRRDDKAAMIGECKDYLAGSATARRPKWRLWRRLRNVMVGRRFKRSETLFASIRGALIRQTWKRARKAKHAGTRNRQDSGRRYGAAQAVPLSERAIRRAGPALSVTLAGKCRLRWTICLRTAPILTRAGIFSGMTTGKAFGSTWRRVIRHVDYGRLMAFATLCTMALCSAVPTGSDGAAAANKGNTPNTMRICAKPRNSASCNQRGDARSDGNKTRHDAGTAAVT